MKLRACFSCHVKKSASEYANARVCLKCKQLSMARQGIADRLFMERVTAGRIKQARIERFKS